MSEELEKLLADEEKKPQPALDEKSPEQKKDEDEVAKKKEHLTNIQKAIDEGNKELKKIRDAKRGKPAVEEEEEIPKIDFNDKGAKAWGKHISSEVDPLKDEMAKEKEEIRNFAIKEFLQDKPDLAKDPEKIKRVVATYEKIRTATERTVPGVMLDLRKAYAAEFADEILESNHNERVDRARGDAIFSDPAVSRGSSSFREEKQSKPHLSRDDEAILAKWGMSPDEWVKMKQAQTKKPDA